VARHARQPSSKETVVRSDRVGIFAPYDWDEATYAAIRLAELSRQFGQVPSFRAHGSRMAKGYCLHADWDDEVRWDQKGMKEWISAQRVIVWLDIRKGLVNYAKSQGVKNVFLPLLHRLEYHRLKDMQVFDGVYCPNHVTYDVLEKAGLKNITYTGWGAGLDYQKKQSPHAMAATRVLVIPEWPMTNEWGMMLAYTLRSLLDAESEVEVTLIQNRQWSKVVNRAMMDLTQHHFSRIHTLRCPTWHTLLHSYEVHDWVLYLPEKVNIGVRLSEVFSQGLPVVSLDLPPIKEFLTHGKSAELIPCKWKRDAMGRATAVLNTHDVFETVHRTIGDRENWYNLTEDRQDEHDRKREYCDTMWSTMLSPV
jgi:hypothetical protein